VSRTAESVAAAIAAGRKTIIADLDLPTTWAAALSASFAPKIIDATVYAVLPEDRWRRLVFTDNTGSELIIPFGLPLGFDFEIVQWGDGQVAVTASPGTSYYNSQEYVQTASKGSRLSISGIMQDVYLLDGDGAVVSP
jgi:hypothetical protein